MRRTASTRLYDGIVSIVLIVVLLSLAAVPLLASEAALGTNSLTGAIWTTDPNGGRVNGNLYTNARNVYLAGGPHKKGAAGLADGIYYFQVTDPSGKTLLSTDSLENRRFNVTNGYIDNIDDGTHKSNPDATRGYGIVVQLWPFTYTPSKGGEFKVWVTTKVEDYNLGQGCFGFIPSLSKTDNFKVKLDEVPKYFELCVTNGISAPQDVAFYVSYTADGVAWTTEQLIYDRTENGYDIFRQETTFPLGSHIYWKFFIVNTWSWISEVHGPELIDRAGIVNKETLFLVNGRKYSYPDITGLEGWTIELYKDGVKIADTQTGLGGYYEFIGLGAGNYMVCEIIKTDEGWAPYGPSSFSFTADESNGIDRTFDFYNYKMLRITDTSDSRNELSSFHCVFTPSNDASGMYQLSSTNPGSFYYNVVKFGEAGSNVRFEISLPLDQENAPYDSPNFILHHTYIGSASEVDVHVYAGRALDGSGWVPDWSKDITSLFEITPAADGKHVTVQGLMPETGEAFVTVHIDFQISDPLTGDEVQAFGDFEYTFGATVHFSIIGVTRTVKVSQ